MTEKILEVDGLVVEFPGRRRSERFRALKGVSIDIAPGETVGLVGESGSGKTTLGRAILGLAPVAEGSIEFEGRSLIGLTRKQRRDIDVQAVFQDPYTSLNPAMTIGDILAEPLTVRGTSDREARVQVHELLDAVGLPVDAAGRRPNEFSGGQRQRIAIARSLALDPKLIVCDEPVSALDLSTQSKVLDLFIDIQRRTGVAYLFISHDLMVVRHISHRIAVMYHGDIVEFGDGEQVTDHPEHPYTQRLLAASPVSDPVEQRKRRELRHELMEAEG
ncbi:ATP-binding cassette domain-containing protein [Microbacterium sp.]|uniref:ATP-binding cassette domain-containing protein n=1 Tax=Microbacterium sp. TaxID=51671 RepID=UPI003F9C1382